MSDAELEDNTFIFGCAVAERRRVEGGGEGSLRGVRGRRIGLEVGQTRAGGGGGFAVKVACCSGHGSYEVLSRLMAEIPTFALCAADSRWTCGGDDV